MRLQNRPLCTVVFAYCIGVFVSLSMHGKFNSFSVLFLAALVIFYAVFMIVYYKLNNRNCILRRIFIYLTVIFFAVGVYNAHNKMQYLSNNIPNDDSEIFLCGQVYQLEKKENSYAVYLKNCIYTYEQKYSDSLASDSKSRLHCLIYTKDIDNLKIGSDVVVNGNVSLFKSSSNEGQFDEKAYYYGIDVHFRMFADEVRIVNDNNKKCSVLSGFQYVRTYFHDRLLNITDKTTSGIYQAMLLGEKNCVESNIKELFMQGSIGHILVVSGLHFSVIGMTVYRIIRKKAGFVLSGLISCIILFLFGVLSGFSTSAIRAFIMFVIFMCANIWGCDYDMLTSLSVAVFVILLINPYTIFLSGFLLSVSAVLGIISVVPFFDNMISCKSKIIKGMVSSLGISIFTLPVMLYYFYYFNPYSMFVNAMVLPFMSFILVDGILAIFVSVCNMQAAKIIILPGRIIIKGIIVICEVVSKIPFSAVYPKRPGVVSCFVYYFLLFLILFLIKKSERYHKVYAAFLVGLCLVFFVHRRYPLEITMLDVGQGQCIYVKTKNGFNMLYDGGSSDVSNVGKYRIIPFLQADGCTCLDIVVVSHLDEDHVSGIREMILDKSIRIKQILLPDTSFVDEAYREIKNLAEENGIVVGVFGKNSRIKDNELEITGVHPFYDFPALERNNTSIVLNLNYKKFNMLLCADMEGDAMNQIMRDNNLLDIDVLQVAHHGSQYTTSEEFLEIIKPEISLISCGENNSYKHPHEELLKRLEKTGSKIFVTIKTGQIDIKVSDNKYIVKCYK